MGGRKIDVVPGMENMRRNVAADQDHQIRVGEVADHFAVVDGDVVGAPVPSLRGFCRGFRCFSLRPAQLRAQRIVFPVELQGAAIGVAAVEIEIGVVFESPRGVRGGDEGDAVLFLLSVEFLRESGLPLDPFPCIRRGPPDGFRRY